MFSFWFLKIFIYPTLYSWKMKIPLADKKLNVQNKYRYKSESKVVQYYGTCKLSAHHCDQNCSKLRGWKLLHWHIIIQPFQVNCTLCRAPELNSYHQIQFSHPPEHTFLSFLFFFFTGREGSYSSAGNAVCIL